MGMAMSGEVKGDAEIKLDEKSRDLSDKLS